MVINIQNPKKKQQKNKKNKQTNKQNTKKNNKQNKKTIYKKTNLALFYSLCVVFNV